MDELILQVIAKVRQMYKYDNRLKDVFEQNASIHISEQNGKLEITRISFDWYDSIIISNGEISYHPEHGQKETLFTYTELKDLLTA